MDDIVAVLAQTNELLRGIIRVQFFIMVIGIIRLWRS